MDFLEILCDPYHSNTGETADVPESMKSFRKDLSFRKNTQFKLGPKKLLRDDFAGQSKLSRNRSRV